LTHNAHGRIFLLHGQLLRLRTGLVRLSRSFVTGDRRAHVRFLSGKVVCSIAACLLFFFSVPLSAVPAEVRSFRISILSAGSIRDNALKGFTEAMSEYESENDVRFIYDIKDSRGDRKVLPGLAADIVATGPDLIIAAGGVEADALRVATTGNRIPVVFLIVSSSVSRGLVDSLQHPGRNLTGIDTNDTALTEKRLWYITRLLPEVRRVFCLNVPNIQPSADSIEIARRVAPRLGLELTVKDVNNVDEIKQAVSTLSRENTDLIMLNPCAPVSQALKPTLLPVSLQQKIPIFGYSEDDIANGAVSIYGPSRYGIGRQGARLAIKVLRGSDPATLPVESPNEHELHLNRFMVERLGLQLPRKMWSLAHSVVDVEP
jgi:putative ABC transport system substrate-binding protein